MRARRISLLSLLAAVCLVTVRASAIDNPKSDAYKAYMEQAASRAIHAVRTELEKQSNQPPNGISLDFAFQVDPSGHVHNVKVTAKKSNQAAEERARHVLANLKLPQFPTKVADEVGNSSIDITTPFVIGSPVHTGDTSVKPDSPITVTYLMRCNEVIMSMLDAEAVKHRGDMNATLEIILLLDPKGHVVTHKVIATPPLQWLNQMAEKVVRDAKLPAMPADVVTEHKGDLVPFATKWVYERKG